jgi:TolB protein
MLNLSTMNSFCLLICTVLFQSLFSEPIRVITIEGSTVPTIGILTSADSLTQATNRIVQFDLEMPNYFKVQDFDSDIQASLLDSGAFFFVKLEIQPVGGNAFKLGYQILDVENSQVAYPGKVYTVERNDLRRAAHYVSNDIVNSLLGEQMAAHSRLLAVQKSQKGKNIIVMDYDGQRPWLLTNDSHINFLPEWGPGNASVLYSSFKLKYPTIFQADLTTGRKTQLLAKNYHVYGPKVSPNGEEILFVRQRSLGADLYLMNLISKKVKQITYGSAAETSPEWSPNGFHIAFTSDRGGNPKLYKMSREGIGSKRLTFEAKSKYLESAAWSPNGDKIAFVGMDAGRLNIYVMNVDGLQVTKLTHDSGNNESPTWSPDGTMIAFSSTRSGSPQIYLMRPDGSAQTQVTKGAAHSAPRWTRGFN